MKFCWFSLILTLIQFELLISFCILDSKRDLRLDLITEDRTREDECVPIDSDDELFDIKPSSFRRDSQELEKHDDYNPNYSTSNGVVFGCIKGM